MMIKSIEEVTIYESPDGGKTVYARKTGVTSKNLHRVDDVYKGEQELAARWVRLKDAVFLNDPTINDLLDKIETIYTIVKVSDS